MASPQGLCTPSPLCLGHPFLGYPHGLHLASFKSPLSGSLCISHNPARKTDATLVSSRRGCVMEGLGCNGIIRTDKAKEWRTGPGRAKGKNQDTQTRAAANKLGWRPRPVPTLGSSPAAMTPVQLPKRTACSLAGESHSPGSSAWL